MKIIPLFLIILSYVPHEGLAAKKFLGEHLLPRVVKANQALALLKTSDYFNFLALLDKDLSIAKVIAEVSKYSNLRPIESHTRNITEHMLGASHAELNRIIALLNVDTKELLPQLSRLSREEINHMATEIGKFEFREFSHDVKILNEFELEDNPTETFLYTMMTIQDAVNMSADGYKHIILGLRNLYATKEFAKMDSILLAAWQKHYRSLSRQEITAELRDNLQSQLRMDEKLLEDLHQEFPNSKITKTIEENVTVKEMIMKLDSQAISQQEAIAYLIRPGESGFVFHEYNSTELHGGIAHNGSIDAKYHAALDELKLVQDILVATNRLGREGMRYLARTLKKETALP